MFKEWALLELMGHRKLAGKVSEETIASQTFIRIDIYSSENKIELTQYYNASAVYCITPTTKEIAISFSKRNISHELKSTKMGIVARIKGGLNENRKA